MTPQALQQLQQQLAGVQLPPNLQPYTSQPIGAKKSPPQMPNPTYEELTATWFFWVFIGLIWMQICTFFFWHPWPESQLMAIALCATSAGICEYIRRHLANERKKEHTLALMEQM